MNGLNKIIRSDINQAIMILIRIVLGIVFLISCIGKLRMPYDFLSAVYGYELLGPKMGIFVAMVMPWIELFVGICLLGSILIGGSLLLSAVMGAMFTFVLSWAIYHGLDISCGCFTSGTSQVGYGTLIRAIFITVFSIIAYFSVMLTTKKVIDIK